MKKLPAVSAWFVFILFVLTSCAIAPKHPALQDAKVDELIPLRHFFINKETQFGFKVSPDGKKLGWIAVEKRRLTIHIKTIGEAAVKTVRKAGKESIFGFNWSADGRRILFRQDRDGDENYHIYMVSSDDPQQKPIDLTPYKDSRAGIHQIIRNDPDNILATHNSRDKRLFDLYRINLTTRKQTLVAQNPGKVLGWITDDDGNLRARVRRSVNRKRIVDRYMPQDNTWKYFLTLDFEDRLNILSFPTDKEEIWALSNRDRDRIGLVRLNIETGAEKLVYEDPKGDVGYVVMSQVKKAPLLAASFPDYQKLHFFDPTVKADIIAIKNHTPMGIRIQSADRRERIATVSTYTDKGDATYLFFRDTKEKMLLSRNPIYRYRDRLAIMRPISFMSRDGLEIHGYITTPSYASDKPAPMVVFVHGGPWARDYWGYRSTVQFLANRGYVVLQINYRGSTGYGRMFKEAAKGEFAGKMHTDLIDGVQWAISEGIADPDKIAIYGHSYGGYATLVGLTFTPDVFACGVDAVGISNLISFTKSVPKYWRIWMPYWYRYVGNPNNPGDLQKMRAKSPLFHVDRIKRPLLIAQGANDPRVTQQESDQIVAALNEAGKTVEYILFEDEGHGIRKWQNRLIFYRRLEDFFAEHLGGMSAGFDLYELGISRGEK
jgi:dipeptidyl aminopeptidase/acylaminoacyl peptidase